MRSQWGFPGADDPAYEHEFAALDKTVRRYLALREEGDFDGLLFVTGQMTAQLAAIYKLSPPAGLLNPATLYEREEPNA